MDNFIFSPNATSIVPENKYFSTLSNKEFIDNENNPRVSDQKNHKLLQTISTNDFKFKEVSSRTFDLYLQFLKTSNIAWINNAEREDR